jgi:hypothetical protein
MSFTFINGVARNREHPQTFQIPGKIEKKNLVVGDFVKVGIELPKETKTTPRGERFWVQLTSVNGDSLMGQIDNELLIKDAIGYNYGDEISFTKAEVLDIIKYNKNDIKVCD